MSFFNRIKGMFGGGGSKKAKARVDINKRFELLGKSGQGSMSKVHFARDRQLGRRVCLKLLDKEKTARFEARFAGLNRPSEGDICMMMRHKNVVQTFEHGLTTTGEPYLVMELIEGVGLNFLVDTKHKQLEGNRISYIVQMANGLEYIHKQGFLHRDICPRNFMVSQEGILKYIDFGLAIPYKPEFCKPGNRTGTPNYLAPEIIKRVNTDHRVDMFALGVTAYETITGSLPWENSRSLQTMLDHLNSAGRDPRDFRPDLDEKTARFLKKAVERDPRERFQTPEEFREAIMTLPKHY